MFACHSRRWRSYSARPLGQGLQLAAGQRRAGSRGASANRLKSSFRDSVRWSSLARRSLPGLSRGVIHHVLQGVGVEVVLSSGEVLEPPVGEVSTSSSPASTSPGSSGRLRLRSSGRGPCARRQVRADRRRFREFDGGLLAGEPQGHAPLGQLVPSPGSTAPTGRRRRAGHRESDISRRPAAGRTPARPRSAAPPARVPDQRRARRGLGRGSRSG